MSQKSDKKHPEKNPLSDLFPLASGEKSLNSPWATAAQLFPYTGLDESALRRRARETNPATGAPWIPAPRGAKFEVHPTLRGLCAWKDHQLATPATRSLPTQCASMKDVTALYHFPVEMQQYARRHYHPQPGEPVIFESSNRVNLPPLLAFFAPFWNKIFCKGSGAIKGIENFEEIDLDTQRALSAQQDVIQKTRDNALANGELHTRGGIERELAEPLTAIFAAFKNFEKTAGGKIKSLLTSANTDPEIIRQTLTLAAAGVQEPLTKLRAQLKLSEADRPPTKELKKAA